MTFLLLLYVIFYFILDKKYLIEIDYAKFMQGFCNILIYFLSNINSLYMFRTFNKKLLIIS